MITLFPKYKSFLAAGIAVLFMICAALFKENMAWYWVLLIFVAGSFVFLVTIEGLSVRMHSGILYILYGELRVKDFIRIYEPLTNAAHLKPNVRFSMKAYLSNAYAAAGDFNKALSILDNMPKLPDRLKDKCEELISINKCSIYTYMGEFDKAKEQLKKIKSSGDDVKILQIRIACGEERCSEEDLETVSMTMKEGGTKLHNLETRFLLGCMYRVLGNTEFSKSYLEEVAKNGGELFIASSAKSKVKMF